MPPGDGKAHFRYILPGRVFSELLQPNEDGTLTLWVKQKGIKSCGVSPAICVTPKSVWKFTLKWQSPCLCTQSHHQLSLIQNHKGKNISFDPLYYYGGHSYHSSASLELHEVRVFFVFQRKHGPQVAEEQLLLWVLTNHIQQLFVHLGLVLFALIRHGVDLQKQDYSLTREHLQKNNNQSWLEHLSFSQEPKSNLMSH